MREHPMDLSEVKASFEQQEGQEEAEQEASWDPELARQRSIEQNYYVMIGSAAERANDHLRGLPIPQLAPFITHFNIGPSGHFSMKLSEPVCLTVGDQTLRFEREVEGDLAPSSGLVEHLNGVRVDGARADEAMASLPVTSLMFGAGGALKARGLEGASWDFSGASALPAQA
ncbi:hypothetical protein KKF91_13720 [Myxococcota bacterium]|nr:hypothetical protein [Myxococcota bacterium]MBU1431596.1 hypothetical protein [Myxococcota bacterium]MBU1900391.1 hypothetical protein [Myxococcota bacterium]